jgi:hypothetical protein
LASSAATAGSAPAPGFQRARLKIEGGGEIPCWFNPKDYTISKSNDWTIKPVVGAGLPTAQFGGGQARELSLDLLFDATDNPTRSVRDITTELFAAMEVREQTAADANKNSGRPPMITFAWGETVSFQAVAKQLSVQYLLFRADGSPVRAQAKVTLVQVEPARDRNRAGGQRAATQPPPQNPTTTGQPGLRSHLLRAGDSLQAISYAAYGDATRWRVIAEANGIDDPLNLPPRGTTLAIPRLPA